MKIKLVATLLACFLTIYADAQFSAGIKAGANYSKVVGKNFNNQDYILGYNGGAAFEVTMTERLGLGLEFLYSGQGSSATVETGAEDMIFENYLDYVQVPVLLKLYLSKGLALEAGPQVGYNVFSESIVDGKIIQKGWAETIDYGVVAGLGYRFNNGLFVQGRYNLGIADVDEITGGSNSVFQLSLGYFIFGAQR